VKKKLFLGCFVFLFGIIINAQNIVNVTSVSGFPSSVDIDNAYSFSVVVTYISGTEPDIFAENLRVKYLSDKMIEEGLAPGIFGPSEDIVLELNNPVEIEVENFTFDSVNFRQGGNIVVIWPSFAGGIADDSLQVAVQGVDPDSANSVMELDELNLQTVWLNEKINWQALEKFGISEGSVLSAEGKVNCRLSSGIDFNANNIQPGIYYFVFNQGNGKMLVFKEYLR
jgi:hypothetical protein